MRICVLGMNVSPLKRTLELEGETLVGLREKPELLITDTEAPESYKGPVVGRDWSIPSLVLEAMDIVVDPSLRVNLVVGKWLDQEWRHQTILGIPVYGMMNENLGAQACAGLGTRFVRSTQFDDLFNNEELLSTLKAMQYNGFVSFSLSLSLDTNSLFKIVSVQTGFPFHGLFNALEGISGRTVEYFTGEKTTLKESWVMGLLLSRWPYPQNVSTRSIISGVTTDMEKHLWLFGVERFKNSIYTDNTKVGWVTAWSPTLTEANRRVLRTARNIDFEDKQYRTDLSSEVAMIWHQLQGRGLIEE